MTARDETVVTCVGTVVGIIVVGVTHTRVRGAVKDCTHVTLSGALRGWFGGTACLGLGRGLVAGA